LTTYTTIANTEIDQDSPVTQPLMTALRDNPLAIAEGDASAPDIGGAVAALAYGGIGTYVWATRTGTTTDVTGGSTVAGSTLIPTGATKTVTHSGAASAGDTTLATGTALSGTWRCMGDYDHSATNGSIGGTGSTLWLRIS